MEKEIKIRKLIEAFRFPYPSYDDYMHLCCLPFDEAVLVIIRSRNYKTATAEFFIRGIRSIFPTRTTQQQQHMNTQQEQPMQAQAVSSIEKLKQEIEELRTQNAIFRDKLEKVDRLRELATIANDTLRRETAEKHAQLREKHENLIAEARSVRLRMMALEAQ